MNGLNVFQPSQGMTAESPPQQTVSFIKIFDFHLFEVLEHMLVHNVNLSANGLNHTFNRSESRYLLTLMLLVANLANTK